MSGFDLGLGGGGGGSYIRWSAERNAFIVGGEEFALSAFVLNLDSVKTGWGRAQQGSAPDWSWDEAIGKRGPQPSSDHRRGFGCKLFVKSQGELSWETNAVGAGMGFQALYMEAKAAEAKNPGKFPVVKFEGSKFEKVGKGSTRVPNFTITKWVDAGSVEWSEPVGTAAPAAVLAAAAAPVDDSDDEF